MTASTAMTIRVSPETKQQLERLATSTGRSKSVLAAKAVSAYVERELEIIDGIKRGLADMKPVGWYRMTRLWPKLVVS